MTSRPEFAPSCPAGGSWYACGNGTQFAGCCGEYPCTDTGCSAGLLYPASFDASKYDTFVDQQCNSAASKFYTCKTTEPAFLGCCEVNACENNGCPSDSLAAMYLSTNPIDANQFDPQPPLAGSSGTQTSSSTASATSSSPAATSTTATSDEEQHTVLVGAISGGAIGGFAVLCAIVFIVWRIKYNSKRSSKKHREDSELYNRTAQDRNHGYNGGEQEKMATAGAVLMHSPYQDSQSPVPPYSPQRSPQDWSPQMQQGFTQHPSIQGVETRSAFQAYSPQAVAHLPHRHQPQSPTLLSPPNDHAHFYNWGSSTALGLSQSEFGGPQFARSHHGPPQELAGDVAQSSVDVDARHIVDDHIDGSMVELPER